MRLCLRQRIAPAMKWTRATNQSNLGLPPSALASLYPETLGLTLMLEASRFLTLKMEMEQIQSALHLSSCVLCVGNVIMAPLDLPRHNNAHLARLTMQGEASLNPAHWHLIGQGMQKVAPCENRCKWVKNLPRQCAAPTNNGEATIS